jgi:hypothetical protein
MPGTTMTSRTLGLSQRGILWLVFFLMAMTLPTFYFLIQAILFVPLVAILFSMFHGSGFALIGGTHVVVIGLLYLGVAHLISKMICAVERSAIRTGILITTAALLISLMSMPIYVGGAEGRTQHYSWIGSFRLFTK